MNITKLAEKYILNSPSVKNALKKGLINYSSLARQIVKDNNLGKKNFDAVLIACRRYYQKIKLEASNEEKILEILKKSKLETKNKMMAVVLEKDIYMPNLISIENSVKKQNGIFRIIEGASAITLITSEEFLSEINKLFKNKIIRKNLSLVEVILKSPKEIETTAGVISYVYSLFRENNINIYETLSCWTDTLFLIQEKDFNRVMELLKF